MRGINKVILIGSLGADPIAKHFPNGGGYAQFSIATSERWQDKQTGDWRESTEWHRIVANGRLGEIACQYLKKAQKSMSKVHYTHVNGKTKIIKNAMLLK